MPEDELGLGLYKKNKPKKIRSLYPLLFSKKRLGMWSFFYIINLYLIIKEPLLDSFIFHNYSFLKIFYLGLILRN